MTPHQIAKQAAHDLEKRFPKVRDTNYVINDQLSIYIVDKKKK